MLDEHYWCSCQSSREKKIQQVIIHRLFGNKFSGRINLKLVFIVVGILLLGVANFSCWLADW